MNFEEIKNKLKFKKIQSYDEIKYVVDSYINGKVSDKDMTEYLKLICKNGLTFEETLDLTDILLNSGDVLDLSSVTRKIVDKHSTGGIGDKVSLIVGPIVAALGLAMPKMSGKGLGYTGGTIDKLESIPGYKTNINKDQFINILNEIGISIIAQTDNLVPADKKIYALRDVTNTVESIPLIASSIMSKKLAIGADIIVIDLKVGKGAFMKDLKQATALSKVMIEIGKRYDKKVVCILTDMNTPLGRNIGNILEIQEVIEYFDGVRETRLDTVVKTISSYLVSYGSMVYLSRARENVDEVLRNGTAKEIFYEWIKAQGGKLNLITNRDKKIEIKSNKRGYIKSINALKLGELSLKLGAGRNNIEDSIDYNAGIVLKKLEGDYIKKGDVIAAVYTGKEIKNLEILFLDSLIFSKTKPKKREIIYKVVK